MNRLLNVCGKPAQYVESIDILSLKLIRFFEIFLIRIFC